MPPRLIVRRWLPLMTRLTNILAIGLIGLILSSSTTEQRKFKGDLHFKFESLGTYYNMDSLAVQRFDRILDSLMKLDKKHVPREATAHVWFYGQLKTLGLIYKPYFQIRVDSATEYIVFAKPTEYNKVKDFKRDDLIREKMKVQIELTGEIIDLKTIKVIDCSTIDKVDKVSGKTYWK